MGFKILMAVRKAIFALYIKPLSPKKVTLLTPGTTSCAPKFLSSVASTSSNPNIVVATILKFRSIFFNFCKSRELLGEMLNVKKSLPAGDRLNFFLPNNKIAYSLNF